MKLSGHLQIKRFTTILIVYAPTMSNSEEAKDMLYDDLARAVMATAITDKLVILGDFNARVGRETPHRPGVIGSHWSEIALLLS